MEQRNKELEEICKVSNIIKEMTNDIKDEAVKQQDDLSNNFI